MNDPAIREVTPEMIRGNHLTHRCVMAAVFKADELISVSLRVSESDNTPDPETSAQSGFPTLP